VPIRKLRFFGRDHKVVIIAGVLAIGASIVIGWCRMSTILWRMLLCCVAYESNL